MQYLQLLGLVGLVDSRDNGCDVIFGVSRSIGFAGRGRLHDWLLGW